MTNEDPRDPPTQPYRPGADDADVVAGAIAVEDITSVSGSYAYGEVIGKGGMGEVLLALDKRMGREVAVKRLHAADPTNEEVARFLREARIQARLEHPAIVPVYELARDPAGRPFFTMKRVSGVTLSEQLAASSASRQRLLRAFAEVCRAIDYAHSRGVVHRDLKPSNIVLGEFGEVYVLDWGIARVVGDAEGGVDTADIDTIEGAAPSSDVIGTPGYISPEQLHTPHVGRPADVYSLGAILFEILAGEPLHPRGVAAIASTMAGDTVMSPALRRPDRNVPPELDRLCTQMLASKQSVRPSARRCADQIEEYLDGDRDVVRRRMMAHDLVGLARDAHREGRSGDAMRAASRALALDPEAADAADIVMHVMLQPPAQTPPEVVAYLQQSDGEAVSQHARAATPGYILIASFLPIIAWNGVRSWTIPLAMFALALVMAVAAWDLTRRPIKSIAHMVVYAIGNSLLLAIIGRLASPLIIVPAMVSFVTASVVTYPTFLVRKWLLIVIMLAGFLVPIVLEAYGLLAPTWTITDAGVVIFGDAMYLRGAPAIATILLAGVATVVMAGVQSARIGNASRAAHHRLVMYAYQLRQLLPAR
jgi:serine/threonine protein kinase